MYELCEDSREDWRRLALTNKETGYMYSTASKFEVSSLPFPSGLAEDVHLTKDKAEKQ